MPEERVPLLEFVRPRRPAGRGPVLAILAWNAAGIYAVWFAVDLTPLRRLSDATGGLASTTLLIYAAFFVGLVPIVCLWGRQRPRDLGLERERAPGGVLAVLALWVGLQVVHAALALARGEPLEVAPDWGAKGVAATLGVLLGQLLGNALFEEMVYRRFLLSQVFDFLRALRRPGARLAAAVVLSQAAFGAMHFGLHLRDDPPLGDLALSLFFTALVGVQYAWVYLRTRNLFFVIGLHALANYPTPLVREAFDTSAVLPAATMIVLITDFAARRMRASRRAVSPPTA